MKISHAKTRRRKDANTITTVALERLQKFLSRSGVASRRAAEEMILAGRVAVNGRVVRELGVKIDPDRDAVRVDGRRVAPTRPKTGIFG